MLVENWSFQDHFTTNFTIVWRFKLLQDHHNHVNCLFLLLRNPSLIIFVFAFLYYFTTWQNNMTVMKNNIIKVLFTAKYLKYWSCCLLMLQFARSVKASCVKSSDDFAKTSVKQSMTRKMCSNFQMSFLHLSQMDSPRSWGFRSGWHFCQIFGSGWPFVRCTPQ